MSNTKHSPGPWKASPGTGDTLNRASFNILSGIRSVAFVPSGLTGTETKANAELVAAAPELLAELQKAVNNIRAWHGMGMPENVEARAWEIYYLQAPEMKSIRELLTKFL